MEFSINQPRTSIDRCAGAHPAPREENEILRRENYFQMFATAGVIPLHFTSVNNTVQKRFYQKRRVQ